MKVKFYPPQPNDASLPANSKNTTLPNETNPKPLPRIYQPMLETQTVTPKEPTLSKQMNKTSIFKPSNTPNVPNQNVYLFPTLLQQDTHQENFSPMT